MRPNVYRGQQKFISSFCCGMILYRLTPRNTNPKEIPDKLKHFPKVTV
jgi:hypothetical protein